MPNMALTLTGYRASLGRLSMRSMASWTLPVFSKLDPGTDIQGDSSADKEATEESKKKAKDNPDVIAQMAMQPDPTDAEKPLKHDPEVKDKTGRNFPHQTDEERMARVASTTEGESATKTREYTPKTD